MLMSTFKIGQYYDQLFEKLSQKEVIDNLEAICYEIVEDDYTKHLTEDELNEKKSELAELSIKLAALEDEKKQIVDEFKQKMKTPKSELSNVLEIIKHKSERKFGTLYKVDDQEKEMMYFFDETGQCVHYRPLFKNEKQTKIKQLKSASNE